MKRRSIILLAGVVLAGLAYYSVYSAGTACCRGLRQSASPDLAWLKMEYRLSDEDFQRIEILHEAYEPACRERCQKIDAQNAELRAAMAKAGGVTPEVERAMAEAARLRGECQLAMMKHFVEVSRAMPAEQGKRYLDWICAQTIGTAHHSMTPAPGTASEHEHDGH